MVKFEQAVFEICAGQVYTYMCVDEDEDKESKKKKKKKKKDEDKDKDKSSSKRKTEEVKKVKQVSAVADGLIRDKYT